MSGLEVLGAISSIITLVEFTQKALARTAEFQAGGKDIGGAFRCINDLLPPISNAVKRTKARIERKEIDEETCTALLQIHRGVERTLEELKAVLKKYTPEEGASKVQVFWKASKSVFQEKKVNVIQQRLHEYVGVLALSHAEAADAGNFSSADKENIRKILATVAQSSTTQAAALPRRCRNLLSLDGGGLRGLSILYILQGVMAKVNEHQDPPLKPCEVFDLIGGSGTGGLIAIMLGRLGMTVEECLDEYLKFFERLFSKHAETSKAVSGSKVTIKCSILRETVSDLIKSRGLQTTVNFRNDENVSCYTFVCATTENGTIVHFQNYILSDESDQPPVTIIDAACGTLSSAKIFEAVEFGTPASKYVAGDLGANNPIDRVWNEAQRIWSKADPLEHLVSCVISAGAGSPRSRAIHVYGTGFTNIMYDIAMQTEETAKKFLLRNPDLRASEKRYYRFNVNTLHDIRWERSEDVGDIKEYSHNYLEGHADEIEQCSKNLQRDSAVPSHDQEIPKYYDVPRRLVGNFIGRKNMLSRIQDYFSTAALEGPKVLILHALGGQGKSQIALKYCRISRKTHQGIFWVNASSEATAKESFKRIANVLDGNFNSSTGDLDEKIIQHVHNTLERWKTRWILVFDNYDKPQDFTRVKDYFPPDGRGDIIITSRSQGLERFGEPLEIPAMASDDGVELLIRNPTLRQANKSEGARIVDRLGGLALAIDQAAAYIEYRGIAIKDFLPIYEEKRKKILRHTPKFGWEYSTMQVHGKEEEDKSLSAFTTWEMSFQQLAPIDTEMQDHAAHFLRLHAFLDHTNVAEDLFRIYWENEESPPDWLTIFTTSDEDDSDGDSSAEDDFSSDESSTARSQSTDGESRQPSQSNDMVEDDSKSQNQASRTARLWSSEKFLDFRAKCRQLSLLRSQANEDEPDRTRQTFSLHPLMRDWLQLQLEKGRRRSYCREAIEIVVTSIQQFRSQGTTASQKNALLAHMDACAINYKRVSKEGKTLGHDGSDFAVKFANMYWTQGRWQEAENLDVQVLEARKRVLGLEHPDTLESMNTLAFTYRNQGRWQEAEGLDVQVLKVKKRGLGLEHPHTLESMNNLASTYWNQGRWQEAEDLDVQVLEAKKRVLGLEHPHTLITMGNLASTYWNQGRWQEAEGLDVQVLEARKRVLGLEHPDTLESMNNLAFTYRDQGRWQEAENLGFQALEMRKRVLGLEHPHTLRSMNNLASTYRDQGRWQEAENLGFQALEARKRVVGLEHPHTLDSMSNLAATYRDQGRWQEAEDLEVQVLDARKRILGPEHPGTLSIMNNLASTYRDQGRWQEAEDLEVQVLHARKRILGPEHPHTLTVMSNLAFTWKSQDRHKEAISLLQECYTLRLQKLGSNHPDTRSTIETLTEWQE